jgi:hypothetical protein
MILLVLLLILPTLDSHSSSFVPTAWSKELISLTFCLDWIISFCLLRGNTNQKYFPIYYL